MGIYDLSTGQTKITMKILVLYKAAGSYAPFDLFVCIFCLLLLNKNVKKENKMKIETYTEKVKLSGLVACFII